MPYERASTPLALHFRQAGRDDAPALLLVHGWMVSGKVWDRLLPLLPEYRIVVPDLRGSGDSPSGDSPGDISLAACAADLVALCDRLDLGNCHLVGHSMGGQLAVLLAAARPERFARLTLMNPVPIGGLPLPDEVQPLFREAGGRREHFARILDMACLQLSVPDREALLDDAMRIAPDVIAAGFEAFRNGTDDVALDRIVMPASVLATDDPFLPPAFLEQAVVARLPNARLHHLTGPGHYPQIETPEPTAGLLRSFS